MTQPIEDPRPALDSVGPQDQIDVGVQEKGESKDGSVAGWAFMMRPLRRKAGRASETASATPVKAGSSKGEEVRVNSTEQDDLEAAPSKGSGYDVVHTETLREVTSEDELLPENHARSSGDGDGNDRALQDGDALEGGPVAANGSQFKVYKRRWFGVVQLVLLNTIVSWDVSTRVSPVSCSPRAQEHVQVFPVCLLTVLDSGSPSQPTQQRSLSTMPSPSQLSTGSAQPFSLHSSSSRPSSSLPLIGGAQSHPS